MSSSPTAKQTLKLHFDSNQTTMTFPQAMQAVIDGKRVTKLEWDDPESYGVLRNERLMIRLEDGWHLWIVSDGDLLGADWIVPE